MSCRVTDGNTPTVRTARKYGDLPEQASRPTGVSILACFFVFGGLASALTTLILLVPGTPTDQLWRLNPRAREGLVPLGRAAVVLMGAVCLACFVAALGLWRLRRWGYWTAMVILAINLLGDATNALVTGDWRTLIGVPIAGAMILYLWRKRQYFQ
jgi:hypothetical protein